MEIDLINSKIQDSLRILVVISNPLGALQGDILNLPKVSLDVVYEWQLLADSIEKNKDKLTGEYPSIALVRANPPTKEELSVKLSSPYDYHIFHFIGHGDSDRIEIENEIGVCHYLRSEELVSLINNSHLRLAFFNSCDSVNIGRELIKDTKIEAIIATYDTVDDNLASFFAGKFYTQLASGKNVKDAFSYTESATFEEFSINSPYVLLGKENWRLKLRRKKVNKPLFYYMDPTNNLPFGYLGKYTCRAGEMITLAKASEQSRKVFNITGISGIGKTTFALKYAQRYSSRFPDGMVYVDMGNVSNYNEILLLFSDFSKKINQNEIAKIITEGCYLILIDNLEEANSQLIHSISGFLASIDWQVTRSSVFFLTRKRNSEIDLLHAKTLSLESLDRFDIIAWLDKEHPNILNNLKDLIDDYIEITHGHPKIIQLSLRMFEYLSAKDVLSRLEKFKGRQIESLVASIMNEMLHFEDNKLQNVIMIILALSEGRARAKLLRYCVQETLEEPVDDDETDSAIENLFNLNYIKYYNFVDTYLLHTLLVRYYKNYGSNILGNETLDRVQRALHSYRVSEIHGPLVYSKSSNSNYITLFNTIAGDMSDKFSDDFKQQWIDNYFLTLHYHDEFEIRMLSGAGHYRKFTFQEVNEALNMKNRAAWFINPFNSMKEALIFRDILFDASYKDPEIQIGYYNILMAKIYFAYENYFRLKRLSWKRKVEIFSGVTDIAGNFKSLFEMIHEIIKHLINLMSDTSIIITENIAYPTLDNIGFKFELSNIHRTEAIWDSLISKYQNVIDIHNLKIESSDDPSNCKLFIFFQGRKTPFQKVKLDNDTKRNLKNKYGLHQ